MKSVFGVLVASFLTSAAAAADGLERQRILHFCQTGERISVRDLNIITSSPPQLDGRQVVEIEPPPNSLRGAFAGRYEFILPIFQGLSDDAITEVTGTIRKVKEDDSASGEYCVDHTLNDRKVIPVYGLQSLR